MELVLDGKKMKAVFKLADRVGASRLVLLGAEELSRGVAKVKDLEAREEEEVALQDLLDGKL